MTPETCFSWMCEKLGFSQGILLLKNDSGLEEVAAQHGFPKPIRSKKHLEKTRSWSQDVTSLAILLERDRPGPGEEAQARAQEREEAGHVLLSGSAPSSASGLSEVLVRMVASEIVAERLRERLGRLEKVAAMGELVYHVAHEINNPLTTVAGYAGLLAGQTQAPAPDAGRGRPRPKPPGAQRETIELLKEEAERALGIARNVLSLARDQEEKQLCDLNKILRHTLALRRYSLQVACVEVETDLDETLPYVEANPGRLQQAFLNILINAEQALETSDTAAGDGKAKALAPDGVRVLRVSSRFVPPENGGQNQVEVQIFNNGPAIPEAWLGKIFETFFTSKPAGVGTGLGLAIARSAVESAGGGISVENTGEKNNKGVVFRFRLPAAGASALASPAVPLPVHGFSDQEVALHGKSLLVLEDEAPIAHLIREVFQAEGCRITSCSTAEKAAEALEHERFDALIADLKLPGKGGRWLFEHLSKRHPALSQKTLFITGDTVNLQTAAFLHSSGQPVLAKPFHVSELKGAVESLLYGTSLAFTAP